MSGHLEASSYSKIVSEHPESNRDYLLPKQTYYHYTMLREPDVS